MLTFQPYAMKSCLDIFDDIWLKINKIVHKQKVDAWLVQKWIPLYDIPKQNVCSILSIAFHAISSGWEKCDRKLLRTDRLTERHTGIQQCIPLFFGAGKLSVKQNDLESSYWIPVFPTISFLTLVDSLVENFACLLAKTK